jgi:2-polyprenyl-3-methyl-5-hydroxy-6-metoxy-1,4-benzoquinol methylase
MKSLDCMDVYFDAEFYDQEFAGREHEVPFFVDQARLANGPVLEVGCGTGRITLPIARAGVEVTGLDVSRPMLELARRKAQAEQLAVNWLQRDCRNIDRAHAFALVFSATNAMQHLHDLDSLNAFLVSARNALRPGGALILDVFNPSPAKLSRSRAVRYHQKSFVDAAGKEVRVEVTSEYLSATQTLAFTLFYLRSGQQVRTKEVKMRCFYPEELLALCRFNALTVVRRYGNYDKTPFTDQSPKQLLLCVNASSSG